ncbi:MAG: magnesium transporter, partial [Chloroflexi bacterium]|nr:magnesium transporter [Chloroflexota bacterium]MCI0804346.1 magnesium transporter [Chloroflexota bacterium]MCI0834972.1 magnesium transporter [Chloroflexota bacterium]MCI0851642.1 magnesium transporter [Chloroflexota bacterium]MCI0874311.1 magnesium transporter [Chloroflexota bacterium]
DPDSEPQVLVSGAPDAEQLDEIQESIEGHFEAGDEQQALSELQELRDPDKAEVLADLGPENRRTLLGNLSNDEIADVLEHMDVNEAVEVSGLIDVDRMAGVLESVSSDVAADVLRGIDWADASQILVRMEDRSAVGSLLLHKDDDAGGLMSTEFVSMRQSWSTTRAINVLRNSRLDPRDMRQLFAVDDDGVLVGVLELPELVFATPGSNVSDVMNSNVVSVKAGTDQEEAARLMQRYEVRSIPVVDRNGRLEGTIAIEDLVDVVESEATEDMFRMIGVRGDVRSIETVRGSVRNRLPWLMVNLATVLATGFVLSLFARTLDSLTILVVYLPVVMGQAGIAGTQTLTIIVRSMAIGEVVTGDVRKLLIREALLAISQGVVVAIVIALVVFVWRGDVYLAGIVAGALFLNLFVAALSGVLIPFTLRALKVDPAASSAVFLTTVTDIVGIAAYMGLATVFLSVLDKG